MWSRHLGRHITASVAVVAVVAPRQAPGVSCTAPINPHANTRPYGTAALVALREARDFAVFRRQADSQPDGSFAAESDTMAGLLDAVNDDSVSIVLIGEVHDDVVAHALQLRILEQCEEACRLSARRLVLSLEMFETDVQRVLDEYVVNGAIREQDFLQDSRPWANYKQHYRPLVEFCKVHAIRVVAANTPRRYVSLVSRGGISSLDKLLSDTAMERLRLPSLPLPAPSAAYRQKFIETIASQMPSPSPEQGSSGECPFIGFKGSDVRSVKPEMMEAQLLWDHTMAKSVASAATALDGESRPPLVIHVCGAFHCAHGLGIPEALGRYNGSGADPDTLSPWLPMDDVGLTDLVDDEVGVKRCPPGVVSVVCWPASVQGTLGVVSAGNVPRSLGALGDWVVITEETFCE